MKTWSFISNFGKNKLVNNTYIFLFIVPFIVNTLNEMNLNSVIKSIPFSWQIFFICAFLFSIGSIIYNLWAPRIIKENNSFSDFDQKGMGWEHIDGYSKDLKLPDDEFNSYYHQFHNKNGNINKNDESKFLLGVEETKLTQYKFLFNLYLNLEHTYYPNFHPIVNPSADPSVQVESMKIYNTEKESNAKSNLKTAFWLYYNYANNARPKTLLLCQIIFNLGTILLGLIIINSVVIVFKNYDFHLFK